MDITPETPRKALENFQQKALSEDRTLEEIGLEI